MDVVKQLFGAMVMTETTNCTQSHCISLLQINQILTSCHRPNNIANAAYR